MSLITKTDVKSFLRLNEDYADGLIESLIPQIEADFKLRVLGSDNIVIDAGVSYQSYTEYYDGNGLDKLIVKQVPIRAVTSLNIDDSRVFGAESLIPAASILDTKFPSGIICLDGEVFTPGIKTIKVVYTAGWKATDAPADFKTILVNYVVATMLEGIGGVNVVENSDFFYKPEKLRKNAEKLEAKYKVFS